jgi:hypothetical protein
MAGLRARTLSGENLERAVFQSTSTAIAGMQGPARARFAGCVYCHEVTPQGEATPIITLPQAPNRWLQHGAFNHAKHTSMSCTDCHAALQSYQTSDIILPTQKSCVACHAPQNRASDSCVTCHGYHNPTPAGVSALHSAAALK